jgi:hypothetical protein
MDQPAGAVVAVVSVEAGAVVSVEAGAVVVVSPVEDASAAPSWARLAADGGLGMFSTSSSGTKAIV